jgi:hypothetical protein
VQKKELRGRTMKCSTRKREKNERSKYKYKKIVVIKLEILNKKGKNKVKISLAKALDLLLWHQIPVMALMTRVFSGSLSLPEVVMLGCVVMDAAPLCQTAWGWG